MAGSVFPLIWVALSVFLLLVFQRSTHKHLHALFYVLTLKRNWAVILYAIFLLPGVLLHEASHWFAAKILGVRTGSFSILPKNRADGVIQLGYVEYYKPSSGRTIRESAIGSAPVISGPLAVFLIATQIFDVSSLGSSLATGQLDNIVVALNDFFSTKDVWIWLYLLFAISNTMMPSASDRKAWPTVAIVFSVIIVSVLLLGFGEALWDEIDRPVSAVASFFGSAFTVALIMDLVALPIIILFKSIIARVRNVRFVTNDSK